MTSWSSRLQRKPPLPVVVAVVVPDDDRTSWNGTSLEDPIEQAHPVAGSSLPTVPCTHAARFAAMLALSTYYATQKMHYTRTAPELLLIGLDLACIICHLIYQQDDKSIARSPDHCVHRLRACQVSAISTSRVHTAFDRPRVQQCSY
jgi:hypothetical protein